MVDRRIGSKGGGEGEGGGAVSTGDLMEYSFNDKGYEAWADRGGDGIGRGTWGRGSCGGFIIGLEDDLDKTRGNSGKGGKGGLVGLVGDEGYAFRGK